MATQLAASIDDKHKEALHNAFISTLETITDLPPDKVRDLADGLVEKTIRKERRHAHKNPEITFYPENPSKLRFEVQLKNVTRSPQEILEDYLERREKNPDKWRIKTRKSQGSRKTFIATRGGGKSSTSSTSSTKSETEELKEELKDLSDNAKQAVKEVLS